MGEALDSGSTMLPCQFANFSGDTDAPARIAGLPFLNGIAIAHIAVSELQDRCFASQRCTQRAIKMRI